LIKLEERKMNKVEFNIIIQLLGLGVLVAVVKMIYSFFPYFNFLDFIVFFIAGYAVGKITTDRVLIGMSIALPAWFLCLFFVLRLGYSNIMQGVGTGVAVL
jgi:hypothetical protein